MPNIYLGNLEPEIDSQMLRQQLSGYKKPRDKIGSLVTEGDLIRIVRGQYVFGKKYQKPFSKFVLANRIWGPSYISAESALSYYGAIPEEVKVTTSCTMKRTKYISTPVGGFEYFHIPLRCYAAAITTVEVRPGINAFIGTPEKALADQLYRQKSIRTFEDLRGYIAGLRLDLDFLKRLDLKCLIQIQAAYKSKALEHFIYYRSLT